MKEEQVLNALSCLTNGALNYYQAPQTVLVRDKLIKDYINNLQSQLKAKEEENEHLKLVLSQIQYCPYDDKCGELYDCSKEEYETMTQSNMKLSLEKQHLEEVIKEAREQLEKELEFSKTDCVPARRFTCEKILEILSKGENK